MIGDILATAGGVVFAGESNGWFKAYDASVTSKLRFSFDCLRVGDRRQKRECKYKVARDCFISNGALCGPVR
jgi:hypothetical protein